MSMSEDKKFNAQNVYNALCAMLDEKNVEYKKHEDDFIVDFTVVGEDFPMQIILNVDAERELIRLLSPIPVTFGDDKRLDGAIATCQVNYSLVDGSFDYNYKKGTISFRMTSSYIDSIISKDLLRYMVGVAGYTIDEYNDKFVMLANGELPLETFLEKK